MKMPGQGECPICSTIGEKICYVDEPPIVRGELTLKLYLCMGCGFEGIETYEGGKFIGHSENLEMQID